MVGCDFDKPSERRGLGAKASQVGEGLGEHVLHGILGLVAIFEDVGTAPEHAGTVFFVKLAQLVARIAGRQALFAWDNLKRRGLAAGHG